MDLLRQLIRSAVESFPVDRQKKEDLLKRLLSTKDRGGKKK